MDINDLRSAVTVLGLLLFLALVIWAYAGRRRKAFDEAARLPLDGEEGSSRG
jgi:cytochrome c oxidase cbb3-type subunit 4